MKTFELIRLSKESIAQLKRMQAVIENNGYLATLEQVYEIWCSRVEEELGFYCAPSSAASDLETDEKIWNYLSKIITPV